ncbi:MAG: hypothetical protein NT165_02845 [Candidatus Falkowbacteria bacterium]|nr:hypothetical protein [Candidatus Falkowbacteria bacterium]
MKKTISITENAGKMVITVTGLQSRTFGTVTEIAKHILASHHRAYKEGTINYFGDIDKWRTIGSLIDDLAEKKQREYDFKVIDDYPVVVFQFAEKFKVKSEGEISILKSLEKLTGHLIEFHLTDFQSGDIFFNVEPESLEFINSELNAQKLEGSLHDLGRLAQREY